MIKLLQYVILICGIVFFVWRGLIPALTKIDTDFPNYYTSSRLVLEHADLSHIYGEDWFQEQIEIYGINQEGKFGPFPPVTALLMIPIAWLPPLQALQTWTVLNLCLLTVMVILLKKVTQTSLLFCGIVVLLSGHALVNNFRFGQWYVMLSTLILLGYYYWMNGRQAVAGIGFGIGAAVKYFPFVYLPLFLLNKKHVLSSTFILTVIILTVIGMTIVGIDVYRYFIESVFSSHVNGNIQNPFSSAFQSWESLLKRAFIIDPILNPSPIIDSEIYFRLFKYSIIGLVLAITAWTTYSLQKLPLDRSIRLQFALMSIVGLLLAPATATYHFLLLVLPVLLLLRQSNDLWHIEQRILIACYSAIGFLPYSFFKHFESDSHWFFLAYPRLWLITCLFIVTLLFIHKRILRTPLTT